MKLSLRISSLFSNTSIRKALGSIVSRDTKNHKFIFIFAYSIRHPTEEEPNSVTLMVLIYFYTFCTYISFIHVCNIHITHTEAVSILYFGVLPFVMTNND